LNTLLADYIASLPAHSGEDQMDPLAGTASPGVSFWEQLSGTGLICRFGALLGTHAAETGLLLASWAFVGAGVLSGRLDTGWLAAWALCLASTVPLRMTTRWLQGTLAIGFGGLMRERLMAGAARIDPDVIRRKGVGQLLGEVLETEEIERLGASGGLETVLAVLELMFAPIVLAWGAAAAAEIVLLIAWVVLTLFLIDQNNRQRSDWTKLRLDLTHRLVEKMTAHRTRAQQQSPLEWHSEEDRHLERYMEFSKMHDRSTARIEAALPRGYVLAAFAVLVPALLSGSATLAQQVITLGAILFAGAGLEKLTFGLPRAATAWISWRIVKPVFDAAAQPIHTPEALPDVPSTIANEIWAQDVFFTHQDRTEPSLRSCTLTIKRGDLLLLQGETGSGKSTLVSLLAGLRTPSSGVILARGLDLQTLGEVAWRRRIAAVPQYHENHILSASMGFNLLMARPYPHSAQDIQEATELCYEMGLGPLLERLPSGLDQMVGETGWQLSQGERSRVFLARALLQGPDVVLIDESLAALDPENVRQCLECIIHRAKTLVVIAHP
jgi:ATP-binding cassette subfamily B protein